MNTRRRHQETETGEKRERTESSTRFYKSSFAESGAQSRRAWKDHGCCSYGKVMTLQGQARQRGANYGDTLIHEISLPLYARILGACYKNSFI